MVNSFRLVGLSFGFFGSDNEMSNLNVFLMLNRTPEFCFFYSAMKCLIIIPRTITITSIMTFVFFAFVAAKEQSQFAAVSPNNSLTDDDKIKDISIDESKGTEMEVIPEPLKESPSQNVAVKLTDEDIQTNDILLAITPDGGCIGIKVKYGMPESFDTEQSHQEWLKQAGQRAIDLKDQIESGACSAESVKDKLDMKPNLSAAMIESLVAKSRAGLCF